MRSRKRLLLLAAAFCCLFAGLALYMTSRTTSMAAAVRPTVTAPGFQGPAFFGDLLSRNNDFFYQSLLGIYRDRYVPPPVSRGHFGVSQSGEAARKVNRRPDRPNR